MVDWSEHPDQDDLLASLAPKEDKPSQTPDLEIAISDPTDFLMEPL